MKSPTAPLASPYMSINRCVLASAFVAKSDDALLNFKIAPTLKATPITDPNLLMLFVKEETPPLTVDIPFFIPLVSTFVLNMMDPSAFVIAIYSLPFLPIGV
jgi:hypothetical protein